MSNVNKVDYFKIEDDKVIYKASFIKRLIARILDFFLALFIPIVMSLIYFEIGFHKNNWYPQPWNWSFITTGLLSIFGILFIMVIFPILNKKNPGQTIGKKILKITILNNGDHNIKKCMLIRELPLAFCLLIPIILQLISGIEINHLVMIYSLNNPMYTKDIYNFIFDILPKGIDGLNNTYMWQSVFGLISMIFSKIDMFILISVSISILASPQNIGFNDNYIKFVIVDTTTIINNEERIEKDKDENDKS